MQNRYHFLYHMFMIVLFFFVDFFFISINKDKWRYILIIKKKNYTGIKFIDNRKKFQSNDNRIRSLNRKIKLHAFNVCFKGGTYRREEIKLKFSLI